MGDRPRSRPPYATAILICGIAETPHLKSYVNGRLALGGVDLRVPVATWLDAVYAIVMDAPEDKQLQGFHDLLVRETARARPDRDTWGATPEQVALTKKLTGSNPPPKMTSRPAGSAIKRGGLGLPT